MRKGAILRKGCGCHLTVWFRKSQRELIPGKDREHIVQSLDAIEGTGTISIEL